MSALWSLWSSLTEVILQSQPLHSRASAHFIKKLLGPPEEVPIRGAPPHPFVLLTQFTPDSLMPPSSHGEDDGYGSWARMAPSFQPGRIESLQPDDTYEGFVKARDE